MPSLRPGGAGGFTSFVECLENVDLSRCNKRVFEALIKAGAFDWTESSRKSLMTYLPTALKNAQNEQKRRAQGQFSLLISSDDARQ